MVRPQWRPHWNRFRRSAVHVMQRPRAGPAHLLYEGGRGEFDDRLFGKSQLRVCVSFTVVAYRALGYGVAVTGLFLRACFLAFDYEIVVSQVIGIKRGVVA